MVGLGLAVAVLVLLAAVWVRADGGPFGSASRENAALHRLALRSDPGWSAAPSAVAGESTFCRAPGSTSWLPLKAATPVSAAIHLQVTTAAGGEETAGVAFRVRDPAHYYLARINTRTNNVRLYRREGDSQVLLATRDLAVPVGQGHALAVTAEGPRLQLALDGEPVLEAWDAVWEGGGLALWAAPGTHVCFQLAAEFDPR